MHYPPFDLGGHLCIGQIETYCCLRLLNLHCSSDSGLFMKALPFALRLVHNRVGLFHKRFQRFAAAGVGYHVPDAETEQVASRCYGIGGVGAFFKACRRACHLARFGHARNHELITAKSAYSIGIPESLCEKGQPSPVTDWSRPHDRKHR
jgi:hypothetical protein